MNGLRVMVVDDSDITVKKITQLFLGFGHEVVATCSSGKDVVKHYSELEPDLVTMDITMPEVDGIEATRQLIAQFPDAKIIVITSHGQEQMVMEAISAGAQGYVLKPIKAEKLKDTIDKILSFEQGLLN